MKLFYIKRHINLNKCLHKSLQITKIISCFLVCSTLSVIAANNASAGTKAELNAIEQSGLSFNNKVNKVLSVDQQQAIKVTGKVLDSQGEPIPGATVRIRGANTGTTTDLSGKFSIFVPSEQTRLRITFVGYMPQEVTVGKQRTFDVVLPDDLTTLDEVVVVGFGTQKKLNLTGSIATVNAKTLEARPVQSVGQALQGVVPGLNISSNTSTGGMLESRPNINIRGITTIGAGSNGGPLILIDGMEGDINAVNPDDIDNISVLKDAAASSLYGARAPFGVILVTTKKGKAGRMQVNFSSSFRSNQPLNLMKPVDSYTFALYWNAGSVNAGLVPFFSAERIQRIRDFQSGKITTTIPAKPNSTPAIWDDGYSQGNDNVNWFSAMYKNKAPSQEHNLSLNGGNENLTYYLSTNMLDQQGLLKFNTDSYQRYTTTAKIDAKLSKWASISYNMRYTREDYVRPATISGWYNSWQGAQGWPVLPLYDPNGFLYNSPSPAIQARDGGSDRNQNDWTYQQLKFTVEPIKGWKIFADFNYKINNYFRHWDNKLIYNHDVAGNPVITGATTSTVSEEASRTNYFSPNIYSEYSKSLGSHNFKVMLGYMSELNKYRALNAQRNGIIVPDNPILNITSGTNLTGGILPPGVGGSYTDWATSGFFGRLNYDYKGRYLLEANLRHDGSSRFQGDLQWKYFPSASVGWNIAEENFWQPIKPFVNTMKFRASYGQLGNQNTSNLYPTYVTMPFGAANSGWLVNGVKVNTSSAPGLISTTLKWETISTSNYGVDMGFFKNRLTANFDYFIRMTNDMIGPAPALPQILGTAVPTTNNTDLKTYGFELALAWQDRLKNGLGYNVRVTLADSKSKITNYPNPSMLLNTYYNGQTFGEIWGYTTIGIAKTQAEMDAHMASLPKGGQSAISGSTVGSWSAGDIMYKDLNGDGKIDGGAGTLADHGDLSVIGNNTAHYRFGLDLSADWKGFDFRAFFQGVLKRDYFQGSYYFWGITGVNSYWQSGALVQNMDYFRNDPADPMGVNLNAYYPRPTFTTVKNEQIQSKYLLNAAYVRMKNLQLGYTIPSIITKKIGVQKFRVYVSGENLFCITKLTSIFDPETIDSGFGGGVYPLSAVYSVGLSVNF